MSNDEPDDEWHGFHEFVGIEDNTWTPKKVKELLRDLIKDNFIFTIDEAVLYSFLLRKGLLNLHNRHDDFFKNLAKASRTEGGKAAIIKYAKSDAKTTDPPDTSVLTTPTPKEDEKISSTKSMSEVPIESKTIKKIPDTVEKILRDTIILDSISVDEEAIQFYLNYSINRLWKKAFDSPIKTIKEIKSKEKTGNKFADSVVATFLRDYDKLKKLKLPKEYSFINSKSKKLIEPFLMQWYIAYKLKHQSYFGNFSGTGAGKTLSAILSSRILKSKITLIICPNDVVNQWKKEITSIFPDSEVLIRSDVFSAKQNDKKYQYLVLNYDKLNQVNSPNDILKLIKQKIDFVILDEIHYSKISVKEHISKRRQNLDGLMTGIRKKNKELRILGLSATPVVNNLVEGKSLLELMTGKIYDDISTKPTVPNAVTLFEKLTMASIRQMPKYPPHDKQIIEVETPIPDSQTLVELHKRPLAIEQVLTEARIPEIIKRIDGQTIIYTEYLGSSFPREPTILQKLSDAVNDAGFTFGLYVGDDHSGKELFLKKQVQVLIASRPISTGVDGLQSVCNNLIFNTLPWTYALYQQIIGRIIRTGMDEKKIVKIHHILCSIGGFPYDQNKMNRLKYKRTLAECAIEGLLPEKNLVTPQQATKEAINWLARLERGEISCVTRMELDVQLTPVEITSRLSNYGDFDKLNGKINSEKSSTTHKRMLANKEEWHEYHRLYRENRENWGIIPYEYWIKKIEKMAPNTIIGDFGCGEAKIQEALGSRVKSFDHVSIDSNVESCDMANVPVDSGTLNVCVFSLSLMGKNWKDYLKEAARCLSVNGYLFISEITEKMSKDDKRLVTLRDTIIENGFEILSDEEKFQFTFIEARKI
jgi:hypothetical protein